MAWPTFVPIFAEPWSKLVFIKEGWLIPNLHRKFKKRKLHDWVFLVLYPGLAFQYIALRGRQFRLVPCALLHCPFTCLDGKSQISTEIENEGSKTENGLTGLPQKLATIQAISVWPLFQKLFRYWTDKVYSKYVDIFMSVNSSWRKQLLQDSNISTLKIRAPFCGKTGFHDKTAAVDRKAQIYNKHRFRNEPWNNGFQGAKDGFWQAIEKSIRASHFPVPIPFTYGYPHITGWRSCLPIFRSIIYFRNFPKDMRSLEAINGYRGLRLKRFKF